MSTASHYAEIRARFFPPTRPIVKASPALWRPKEPAPPRQVVRRLIDSGPVVVLPPRSRIAGIVKLTCTMFGLTKAVLLGAGRDQLAVKARTYAAVRLFYELGLSKSHIGTILNRDHSSIFNIIEKASGRPGKIQSKRGGTICE